MCEVYQELLYNSRIFSFKFMSTLFAPPIIMILGIIRLRTDVLDTNTDISSSGLLSENGSKPSGITSDMICLEAAYTASLSPTDTSSACSMYTSIRTSVLIPFIDEALIGSTG